MKSNYSKLFRPKKSNIETEHGIKFSLNDKQNIFIDLEEALENVHCCYYSRLFLTNAEKRYLLRDFHLAEGMERFQDNLTKVINNQLPIHPSIKNNIGKLYAKYFFHYFWTDTPRSPSKSIVFEKENWVGEKYLMWTEKFALWMYNGEDGSIILELTPYFSMSQCWLADETPNFIAYEKFVRKYKSIFKQVIPKEVAQQWCEQANTILEQIEKNIVRMQEEYDAKKNKKLKP